LLNNLRGEHPITRLCPVAFLSADQGSPPSADGTLAHLLTLQRLVWDIHVDETLEEYIVRLVSATRSHPDLVLGASPRASLALFKTSQALAALRGRDHVIPDDIKYLSQVTLTHRLIVRPESELRGRTAARVLQDVIRETPLEIGPIKN
jgi:MoxR-like ATPase